MKIELWINASDVPLRQLCELAKIDGELVCVEDNIPYVKVIL